MELPYTGRATINENFDSIEIVIPAKKNWLIVLFLCAWMGGWFFGETTALTGLTSNEGPGGFLFFWLIGWTVGGLFALRILIWMMVGKEIIWLGQGIIKTDKKGAIFNKAKTYDIREAKNFRAQEDLSMNGPFGNYNRNSFLTLDNGGTIKFDYGLQTVKMAAGIDESEANHILERLRAKRILTDINFK